MAHGLPDYGAQAAKQTVYGLADLGELAARLGSIVSIDRRGDVVNLDDFEGLVLRWYSGGVGGTSCALDSTYPRSGSQAVKLSLGNWPMQYRQLIKGFSLPLSSRIGAEISFIMPDSNTYLLLYLIKNDGQNYDAGVIRIDFNSGSIAYRGDDADYHDFVTGLAFETAYYTYHTIKLVVDFDTNRFVRFIYAGHEYDLSSYPLYSTPQVTDPRVSSMLELAAREQAVASIYMDDFILTQNEP